jgi:hypothetical protein
MTNREREFSCDAGQEHMERYWLGLTRKALTEGHSQVQRRSKIIGGNLDVRLSGLRADDGDPTRHISAHR